jgi:sodium/proline symporter
MFITMIGFTYITGLSSLWMAIGWAVGDYLDSLQIHHPVSEMTERHGCATYGGLLSHWHDTNYNAPRFIVGIITLLFLGTYATAQLSTGSKAPHVQ